MPIEVFVGYGDNDRDQWIEEMIVPIVKAFGDEVVDMPTFPNAVRMVEDRKSKFILKTHGWGVFPICAKVTMKDGHTVKRKHQLVLRYEEGTPTRE